MNRAAGWGLAGILALAVSACAVVSDRIGRLPDDGGFDPAVVRAPRPTLPNVFVMNGHLVVDQEPIRINGRDFKDKTVTIAWALAAGTSARWPEADKAITIRNAKGERPADWRCTAATTGKILSCSYTFRPGTYKYTLAAKEGDKDLPPLDPYIVNIE
jgi:hypothetical protein